MAEIGTRIVSAEDPVTTFVRNISTTLVAPMETSRTLSGFHAITTAIISSTGSMDGSTAVRTTTSPPPAAKSNDLKFAAIIFGVFVAGNLIGTLCTLLIMRRRRNTRKNTARETWRPGKIDTSFGLEGGTDKEVCVQTTSIQPCRHETVQKLPRTPELTVRMQEIHGLR